MINLNEIIIHLRNSGIDIQWADSREPNLDDFSSNIDYFIGYYGIKSLPSPFIPQSSIELIDSDEVQTFETKIICTQNQLYAAWNNLKNAFLNYNPDMSLADYSVINHVEGAVIGKGFKIVHLDRWSFSISP